MVRDNAHLLKTVLTCILISHNHTERCFFFPFVAFLTPHVVCMLVFLLTYLLSLNLRLDSKKHVHTLCSEYIHVQYMVLLPNKNPSWE